MNDLELFGFLILLAANHLEALLIPLGLATSAAFLNFAPVKV